MPKTLLDGVNDLLQAVNLVTSQSQLQSLTDSPRQVFIDQAVQAINSTLIDLYDSSDTAIPTELAEDTITLVQDDRDYALPADLVQMRFPLHDREFGVYIREIEYISLINNQAQPAQYTGLPNYGAIRQTDGELYLDRIPTASEAGRVYHFQYDKQLLLETETDTFPFTDTAFRPFMDATTEIWRRSRNIQFDSALYSKRIGDAASMVRKKQQGTSWQRNTWRRR